jgi:transposase
MAEKKESVEAAVRTICRVTREKYSAEEKVWMAIEGLRGETGVAALCRREGIPSNPYCRPAKVAGPSGGARTSSRRGSSGWSGTQSGRPMAGR